MKVRIISGVVGGILAILILILHKTFVFPLAIAALICIALFELFRAGKCLHCRISIGAGFLYGAALPFLQYYGNTSATIALTFLCIVAMFAEMVLLHKHCRNYTSGFPFFEHAEYFAAYQPIWSGKRYSGTVFCMDCRYWCLFCRNISGKA